jgi:hypothetical protein
MSSYRDKGYNKIILNDNTDLTNTNIKKNENT